MINFFTEYYYFHVEFYLFFFGLFFLLFSIYDKKVNSNYFNVKTIFFYIIYVLLGFFIVGWHLWVLIPSLDNVNMYILYVNNLFIFSAFICYVKIFILIITVIYFVIFYDYFKNTKGCFVEYLVGIYFLIGSIFLFMSSYDFLIAYLLIELQAFLFYYIFMLLGKHAIVVEAVLKYFILNVFASLVSILGVSIIYGSCGTTKFIEISLLFFEKSILNIFTIGMLFFLIGIFFKLALVPFHYWIGDIYEGLPLFVIIYYGVISKIPYLVFLVNLLIIIKFSIIFYDLMMYIALISILYSSLIALYEINIMRILAYGTISHLGYIILSFSLGTFNGIALGLNYMFVYSILILGTLIVLYVIRVYKYNENLIYWNIVDIIRFSKFSKINYFITIILVSFLLSFIGIPPFAGFFIKMGIFIEILESGNYFLFFIIGFLSVVSGVFYLRVIRFLLFFKENEIKWSNWYLPLNMLIWIIIFCFVFNLLYWYFQSIIIYIISILLT